MPAKVKTELQWKHLYDSEVFQTRSFAELSWYSLSGWSLGSFWGKKSWISQLKCFIRSDWISQWLNCTSWNQSALFCPGRRGLRWANLDATDEGLTAAKRLLLEETSWGKNFFIYVIRASKSLFLWKNNSLVCFASEWSLPWFPLSKKIHRHVNYICNLIQWYCPLRDLIGKPILSEGRKMRV